MKRSIRFVISSLAMLTTSAAFAFQPYPCAWYLELNYGTSKASGIELENTNESDGSGGNGPGWSVNGGYKFTPNIAAEIGYTNYARTSLGDNDNGQATAKVDHYSIEGAAKGIWPILPKVGIDIFGKLGVAWIHSSVDNLSDDDDDENTKTSAGVYVGGGVEYALAHELLLNVQWERAYGNSSTGRLDLLSAGIAWLIG